jgi:hypothetical protein
MAWAGEGRTHPYRPFRQPLPLLRTAGSHCTSARRALAKLYTERRVIPVPTKPANSNPKIALAMA